MPLLVLVSNKGEGILLCRTWLLSGVCHTLYTELPTEETRQFGSSCLATKSLQVSAPHPPKKGGGSHRVGQIQTSIYHQVIVRWSYFKVDPLDQPGPKLRPPSVHTLNMELW